MSKRPQCTMDTEYNSDDEDINLRSSVQCKGKYVTQIIHFKDGEKRTFNHIDSKSIKQGQFTKLKFKNGSLLMINDKNVNCIEVFEE